MERLASCYNDKMVLNPYKSLKDWRKQIKERANKIKGSFFSQIKLPSSIKLPDKQVAISDMLVVSALD